MSKKNLYALMTKVKNYRSPDAEAVSIAAEMATVMAKRNPKSHSWITQPNSVIRCSKCGIRLDNVPHTNNMGMCTINDNEIKN